MFIFYFKFVPGLCVRDESLEVFWLKKILEPSDDA